MKKLLFGMAMAVGATSCLSSSVILGSGREAKGAFDIRADYTSIAVSNGITVELIRSETGEGLITADEEVLEHVSITQEDGRVKVSYVPGVTTVRSTVKTVVTMPLSDRLSHLDVSSAGRVTAGQRLLCSSMEIEGSSAAAIDLDMDVHELSIRLSGAADFGGNVVARTLAIELSSAAKCEMEGSADLCKVEAGSAAKFRGLNLVCRRSDAGASSGAEIEISATEELEARASGGGAVRYKGAPMIIMRGTSSGGSVRKID